MPMKAKRRASSAGALTCVASSVACAGKAGASASGPSGSQWIGAPRSDEASRSSPNAAARAFSKPGSTVSASSSGGQSEFGRRLQRRGNARFLGAQLGQPRVGLLQFLRRSAVGGFGGLAVAGAGAFEIHALSLRLGDGFSRSVGLVALRPARRLDRTEALATGLFECRACGIERRFDLAQRRQAGQLAFDLALQGSHFLATHGEPTQPLFQLGDLARRAVAQRFVVGDLAGQAIVLGFGRDGRRIRRIARLLGLGGALLLADLLLFQSRALSRQLGDGGLGVALAAALARQVLLQSAAGGSRPRAGRGDALGLGAERIVRDAQALKRRRRRGFIVAQRR